MSPMRSRRDGRPMSSSGRARTRSVLHWRRSALRRNGEKFVLAIEFDLAGLSFTCRGVTLSAIEPLIDGEVPIHSDPRLVDGAIVWDLEDGRALLEIERLDAPL